ncbi:MAG: hypothetical protein CSB55_08650 [Candidatus Cloacimonadota bacterium]|nr:MAG: hypothetical protein CSB55_08650 [Candidatus Cloacimonadota bacterium]
MKILFFIESLQSGGKERRLVELLKGLSKYSDLKCDILLNENKIDYKEVLELDANIHCIAKKSKYDLGLFLRIFQIIKKINPDIIYSWGHLQSVYSVLPKILLNKKLINGMVTTAPGKVRKFSKTWTYCKLTFPFSDVIISNSKAGLISHNVPVAKRHCIYNGFNFKRLEKIKTKDAMRKELGISSKYTVGMVGAFAERKDFDTFAIVANHLLETRYDITFIAVGDGYNLENVKGKVKEKIKERFIFTGKRNDVESIVNIFDVAVLLTKQNDNFGEGISNSIMEYMALGKAVIASDNGGNKEIIINNKTGFLTDNNPKTVIKLISDIIDNEEKKEEMGKKGLKVIKDSFSIDKMVANHVELFIETKKD